MRRLIPLALAVLAAVGASAGLAGTAAAATTAPPRAPVTGRVLPPHVYAPYVESWDASQGSPAQLAAASGARYVTLAFLSASAPGSCTAYWNGSPGTPVSATAAGSFGAAIAAIQRAGGQVIPSFGGYAADTTGTELADSCASPGAIARAYENLAATYHVTRIDLDVEGSSVTDAAGIRRRNEAVALAEAWARSRHQVLQFSYTLPVTAAGLPAAELSVLRSAVAEHAAVSAVNLMTFDYYYGTPQDMLADAESAATAAEGQLAALYPRVPAVALWHELGITTMPGIDDYGPGETFPLAQAPALERWAAARGLGELSVWALQRDNGGCPGTKGASDCSGVAQPPWAFSHVFEAFDALRAHF